MVPKEYHLPIAIGAIVGYVAATMSIIPLIVGFFTSSALRYFNPALSKSMDTMFARTHDSLSDKLTTQTQPGDGK